MENNIK